MKRIIYSMSLLMLSFSFISAQSDSAAISRMKQYVDRIDVFNQLVPREKVYLHFDNVGYMLSETIWFKAYLTSTSETVSSGVLYVELINAKGKILETKKLKIENGKCHGEFLLDNTNVEYFPGFYEIRAYTKFMLNFGEEMTFSRVFPVFEKFKPDGNYSDKDLEDKLMSGTYYYDLPNLRKKPEKQNKINVHFYPEGGNLVNGIESQVAFKATDENGKSIEITGHVMNPKNEIITSFSTQHSGMGLFTYTPVGEKNKVKVHYEGKDYLFDLPKKISSGYGMTINNFSKNDLLVKIEKTPEIKSSLLGISVLSQGEVSFFQSVELNDSELLLKIPKTLFLSGVNRINLFDSKGEVFAERLFFISPEKENTHPIEATPDKAFYKPMEKINIRVAASPNANFSLAVRDADLMPGATLSENIANYFLLSSELQGYIENPAYYFDEKESSRLQDLDLLMRVQGWKKYEWQAMAGVIPFEQKYNLENSLTIKGQLFGSGRKNAEVNVRMKLAGRDSTKLMDAVTQADKDGVFYAFAEDFYGDWELSISSPKIDDCYKNIRLDRWFAPEVKDYTAWQKQWTSRLIADEPVDSSSEIKLDKVEKMYVIPEVQIEENREKDFIHDVGKEMDRMIDTGEKFPHYLHDYLLQHDKQYAVIPDNVQNASQISDPIEQIENGCVSLNYRKRTVFFRSLYQNKWVEPNYILLKTGSRFKG